MRVSRNLITNYFLNVFNQCERILVGFSGGLDSTVLLDVLSHKAQFKKKLYAVHINHGLTPHANNWEKHCLTFCKTKSISFVAHTIDFERNANIEANARRARYAVFESLMQPGDVLVLAHHKDDQVETLLLNLFRGAGIDGLSSMAKSRKFGEGFLVRPFLEFSRKTLEDYAKESNLVWIDDPSNEGSTFSRNFLRNEVLPLLKSKWPSVVDNLQRTILHCQEARENVEDLAIIDCPELRNKKSTLDISCLNDLKLSRIKNVLRSWLKNNEIKIRSTLLLQRIVEELIFVDNDVKSLVQWQDIAIRKYQNKLYILKKENVSYKDTLWENFPAPLLINDQQLIAEKSDAGILVPSQSKVEVRFRKSGECIRLRGQTKELKKLFQQWKVPPWLRNKVPLVYINGELAEVVGYAISDKFFQTNQKNLYQLKWHP